MADKVINVSYETLFELLRREKNRDELQELDNEFFQGVIDYLTETEAKLDEFKQKTDLQSIDEKSKIDKQFNNIRKIIHEMYDRREKKIIDMAMNKTRTSTNIIDVSNLLTEEKILFDALVDMLDSGRKGILIKLLAHELPKIEVKKEESTETKPTEENKDNEEKENQMVRFVSAVPKFVGPELEVYGPFEAEDIASLPKNIANLLVKKNRAELMGE
jgi:DNA replication factor GINS